MDGKKRMDNFFAECDALHELVTPVGMVSAQEFHRLLAVAKQYRRLCQKTKKDAIDESIRIPKAKTVIELESRLAEEYMSQGFYDAADVHIRNLEDRYGNIPAVLNMRGKLNLLWWPTDAD